MWHSPVAPHQHGGQAEGLAGDAHPQVLELNGVPFGTSWASAGRDLCASSGVLPPLAHASGRAEGPTSVLTTNNQTSAIWGTNFCREYNEGV